MHKSFKIDKNNILGSFNSDFLVKLTLPNGNHIQFSFKNASGEVQNA